MRKTNVTDDEIAGLAYETYCKAVGGKSFKGDPLPDWEGLKKEAAGDAKKENIVMAWKKGARAVASLVEKRTPDLSHLGTGSMDDPSKIPPYPITGTVTGRASSATPNLSSPGVAVSSMPPPIHNLKTRTKCCGSHSMSLGTGGKYSCPCGDTTFTPEEIKER